MPKKNEEIIKEALAKAKELKEVRDEIVISYITPKGNYQLSIEVNKDFDDNKYYDIRASKVVKNCACRLDNKMSGLSTGDQAITEACLWFFEVINKFEKAPWRTEEDLLDEADFIMNVLEPR